VALAALTSLLLFQGRPPASVLPTLGLFAAVAFRALPSLNRIANGLQALRFAAPAVDRISEDLQPGQRPQRVERVQKSTSQK
jgi:ATP-binding cassette, subfamily B, bacterial PglK